MLLSLVGLSLEYVIQQVSRGNLGKYILNFTKVNYFPDDLSEREVAVTSVYELKSVWM